VLAGDHHDGIDLIRKQDRPLQRLHPAERGRRPTAASRSIYRYGPGTRARSAPWSGDGDPGKSEPYGLPVAGSIDEGPVVPATSPPSRLVEDDEIVVGCRTPLPGPDHPVPPAESLTDRAVAVLRRENPVRAVLFVGRSLREPGPRGRRPLSGA